MFLFLESFLGGVFLNIRKGFHKGTQSKSLNCDLFDYYDSNDIDKGGNWQMKEYHIASHKSQFRRNYFFMILTVLFPVFRKYKP
jgi:hypothetical protein